MWNRLLYLALFLLSLSWLTAGHTADPPPPTSDVQDLLCFGSQRPLLLRFHLRIDGRAVPAAWDDFLTTLFRQLDRNGDGTLDKTEAEAAPRAQALRELFQGNTGNLQAGKPTLSQMDNQPADGKVTLTELKRYYRRFNVVALQLSYRRVHPGGNPLTGTLFKHLDTNRDGRLSLEELKQTAKVLQKLDQDDDEMIRPREILPSLGVTPPPAPGMMMDNANASLTYLPEDAIFHLVNPGEQPPAWIDLLLQHYDRNQDQQLTAEELRIDLARFAALDLDRNGQLSREELGAFLNQPPDLELRAAFSRPAPAPRWTDMTNPLRPLLHQGLAYFTRPLEQLPFIAGKAPADLTAESQAPGEYLVRTPDSLQDLRGRGLPAGGSGISELLRAQFQSAGPDAEAQTVAESELGQPQFQALRLVAAAADRNGDGKISRAELDTIAEIMDRGAASVVHLTLLDHDRGLFELLDTNHDGELGQRELRQAHLAMQRILAGRAELKEAEVPRLLQVLCGHGRPLAPEVGRDGQLVFGRRSQPRAQQPIPKWFERMDRNGDGDLSLREFLGRLEDFKRLDRDGDGLIDVTEALQAGGLSTVRPR